MSGSRTGDGGRYVWCRIARARYVVADVGRIGLCGLSAGRKGLLCDVLIYSVASSPIRPLRFA